MPKFGTDRALCERANASARVAGISGTAQPVDPDVLRIACGILIAGGRPRRKKTISEAVAKPMVALLRELDNPRLTAEERGVVLRFAVDELVHVTSATTADWLQPQYPPPGFLSHTPVGARYRQAQSLLRALLQEQDPSCEA